MAPNATPRLARPLRQLTWTAALLGVVALLAMLPSASGATGGPDTGGFYVWKDGSDGPGYTWNSIVGAPGARELFMYDEEETNGDPQNYNPIDISPIGFEYFRVTEDTVYINNNGFIAFSRQNDGHETSMVHPQVSAPNHLISGCWRDLYGYTTFANSGSFWYVIDAAAQTAIFEWNAYEHQEDFELVTFQIRLNGADDTFDIVINNCDEDTDNEPYSIGMENEIGNMGLNWDRTTNQIQNEWIRFYPRTDPVAKNDTNVTILEDDPTTTIDVLQNDADPDGDAITLDSLVQSNTALGTATIVAGKIEYTVAGPDVNWRNAGGNDTITYTISDPYGNTDTAIVNVSIAPVNDAPTGSFGGIVKLKEDSIVEKYTNWLGTLTVGPATATDESNQKLSVEMTKQSGDETIFSQLPAIDIDTGDLTWKLAKDRNGEATYSVQVREDAGTPADQSDDLFIGPFDLKFEVSAVNDAPTFTVDNAYLQLDTNGDPIQDEFGVVQPLEIHVYEDPDQMFNDETMRKHRFDDVVTQITPAPESALDELSHEPELVLSYTNSALFDKLFLPKLVQQPSGSYSITFATARDASGEAQLKLRVDDDHNTADTGDDLSTLEVVFDLVVLPSNDVPTAKDDVVIYLARSGPLVIDAMKNDGIAPDVGEELRYHFDATTNEYDLIQPPAGEGEAQVVGGKLVYQSSTDFTGTTSFRYTIDDWGGAVQQTYGPLTASATVSVTVVDESTMGNEDRYLTVEDSELSVPFTRGLLSNDANPHGYSIYAELFEDATNGAATVAKDGAFSYTPDPDFFGTDTFQYRIMINKTRVSDPIDVIITVAPTNDVPSAVTDEYIVSPNGPTRIYTDFGVLSNDVDRDGEPLTAHLSTKPRHGRVELNEDGGFIYTPNHGFTGMDTWFYTAMDDSAESYAAEVRMHVQENQAPVADFMFDVLPVGRQSEFTSDSVDVDGKLIRHEWDFGNGATSTDINPSYIFEVAGEYTVTLTVTDNSLAKSSITKKVLVLEDYNRDQGGSNAEDFGKPMASAGANRTVLSGSRVLLDGTGGDGDRAVGFEWVQTLGPKVRLSNDKAMQTSFTAPTVGPDESVHLEFQLTIFDGFYKSDPVAVRIVVQDIILRPVANAGNDLPVKEGKLVTLRGEALGYPDDADITLEWTQIAGPSVGIGGSGSKVIFRAPDVDEETELVFQLDATDGRNVAEKDNVTITVQPVKTPGGFRFQRGFGIHEHIVAFEPVFLEIVPMEVSWDFGDGTNSTDYAPTHGYTASGDYTVTMTVLDHDGATTTFERQITVDVPETPSLNSASKDTPAPAMFLAAVLMLGMVRVRKRS